MATEGSKKQDEQHSHDQRQHVGAGMDLASHVDLNMMRDAILQKRYEAATGQRLAEKRVGLFSAEEVKAREVARGKQDEAGSEKNTGVYQF